MKLAVEISVLSFPLDRVGRVLLVSTYFWWTPVERAKRVWKSVSGVRRRYSKAAVPDSIDGMLGDLCQDVRRWRAGSSPFSLAVAMRL